MRCRVGDLAVVVKCYVKQNLGRPVKCIRLLSSSEVRDYRLWNWVGDWWLIDAELTLTDGCRLPVCLDSSLRPIRDNDGEDEMLRIARLKDQDKANALRHAMNKRRERLVEEAPKQ